MLRMRMKEVRDEREKISREGKGGREEREHVRRGDTRRCAADKTGCETVFLPQCDGTSALAVLNQRTARRGGVWEHPPTRQDDTVRQKIIAHMVGAGFLVVTCASFLSFRI
jgi:hypothetical protein